MKKKILKLTLKKKWFDLIAKGEKKEEYRDIKPYWNSRFRKAISPNSEGYIQFDEIHFTNGYGRNKPFMRVEFKGYDISIPKGIYTLKLGKILEIRNWKGGY